MATEPLERRTSSVVVPLTAAERHRLEAWALAQERECSQAIRFLLREVLATDAADDPNTPVKATPAVQTNGAGLGSVKPPRREGSR